MIPDEPDEPGEREAPEPGLAPAPESAGAEPSRPEAPRAGESLEVTVEKGVYRGLGLARHQGQVVFVPRALPGERLRVEVASVTPGYLRAIVRDVLSPSPERRAAPCAHAARCGGCAYQELAYPAQLRLKEQILREALERAGVPWDGAMAMAASPEEGWRTRCVFHVVAGAAGALRVGLHEEGSHRVVDLERCLQISGAMNAVLRRAAAALAARPRLVPRLRALHLAESAEGDRRVLSVEGSLAARDAAGLAGVLDAPDLTGLGAIVERGRYLPLRGTPYLESTVLGVRLRSHAQSFFQANRFLVEALARQVREWTPPGGRVLDLYAGVGLFALTLAPQADEVVGVELGRSAAEDAAANARRAGARHVKLRRQDVLEALRDLPAQAGERVILDPPRTGAGREVVAAVAARRPESVVYVSCDPPTLARDLKLFSERGLRVDGIAALDLFPDTFHLETVVRLRPA